MKVTVFIVAIVCAVGLATARHQNVCALYGGLELVPHVNCNQFYMCSNGIPIEMKCASGLLYNPETLQCDWSHNVDCMNRIIPGDDVVAVPAI
ncbi:hypothetical protein EVAR_39601_1 [Eumeta japonica]|uniref:Chitin-binding type-2 domain-containing protein n=1 Tax=Eumeta variegata TaxID=151549 RepID=A0A4C1Y2A7_EUMVA|nr:hypothetical protein EVAR_39601_1 [Eumeta japonica]